MERRNTLALGYCFSSINADVQGKPSIRQGYVVWC
jgi:hypothetical protein